MPGHGAAIVADERGSPVDPEEARFRRRARGATLGVTLFLVSAEITADIISNLFGVGSFHANEAILGTLFGGALLIGGIEILPRAFRK